MRHKLITASLLLCSVASLAPAQSSDGVRPFAEFDREVRTERAGFAGDKSRLSLFFKHERSRLGESFEAELLKYLGSDAEKHYWLSLFLTEPSYLHGSTPLPQLALRLQQRGLDLLRGKRDQDSLGLAVSLNVVAALLSVDLDLRERAVAYKNAAEELITRDADLGLFFPGMSAKERKLYDSIASARQTHRFKPEPEGKPVARVSSGMLNRRAKKLPTPPAPAMGHLRVDAEVKVEVVVDEEGKIIWARAVEGHPLLREAAVQAARQAEFDPLLLSGKPVSFGGYLIYKSPRRK